MAARGLIRKLAFSLQNGMETYMSYGMETHVKQGLRNLRDAIKHFLQASHFEGMGIRQSFDWSVSQQWGADSGSGTERCPLHPHTL